MHLTTGSRHNNIMNDNRRILITICARGGSKGIPGKNIKNMGGKPLLAYTTESASKFANYISSLGVKADISLSTDSANIKKVAEEYGLKSNYMRPDALASDLTGKIETIRHLLEHEEKEKNVKYEYVLDLDVTSPIRTLDDLKEGFNTIENDPEALNIFSVSRAAKNPYFCVVEQASNGYYSLVKKKNDNFLNRQTSPKVFDTNASFYFYRRKFFDLELTTPITEKSLIYEMKHICFDLDEPVDFEFMDFLFKCGKLDWIN